MVKEIECDVLVIGSGAGGMVSAIRAHDLGLKTMLVEKADRFGGTSAVSGGGIWIPMNADFPEDSEAAAMDYLRACTKGKVPEAKLLAYVRNGKRLVDQLRGWSIGYSAVPGYSDYCPWLPGAMPGGRTMMPHAFDARKLGDEIFRMREPHPTHKVFGRMQVNLDEMGPLIKRTKGWWRTGARMMLRYWTDVPFRLFSSRDRRVTTGNAMIGGLRKAMLDRGIPLKLKTAFSEFITEDDRVVGAVVVERGNRYSIRARHGVIVATGGFEKNQGLRDKYMPKSTPTDYSLTPGVNNVGDALTAGIAIGADTEFLDQAWWVPAMRVPAPGFNNADMRAALFMERGYPHTMCVNRNGVRFANEAMSYNDFGAAMLEDDRKTGANAPCWFIFDATARNRYPLGTVMPSIFWPDWRLPREWMDNVLYRAGSIHELAHKIDVDPAALAASVARYNGFAKTGKDEDFDRGGNSYDTFFGDFRNSPNPCLGPIDKAPFYAMQLDIGDIGTKGGLKTDANANVLRADGSPIVGLYATGNVAGAVTYDSYPGAGATLGPAMTFGMVAAEHIAHRSSNRKSN